MKYTTKSKENERDFTILDLYENSSIIRIR